MQKVILPLVMFSLFAACGRGDNRQSPAAESAALETASNEEAASGPGRDLSMVNVCELVPADAVAAAVTAQTAGPPEPTDPGFDGKGCRYQYKGGGGGITQYTEVSLHPPDDYDFQRSMQSFEKIDLQGLGDAAFWGKRSGQTDLYALKKGDVSLHVQARGQELEQAQAIARTVLDRL
jgi:hypothetical protein